MKLTLDKIVTQEIAQEETRQKLALQTKLRTLNDEKEALAEQLEEEEEAKKAMERQLADMSAKVQSDSTATMGLWPEFCGNSVVWK